MLQKSRNQNSNNKDGCTAKLLIDFFMFSSLINGITCNSDHYDRSRDLRMLTDQRTDNLKKIYQVFCQRENGTARSRNELNDFISRKILNCSKLARSYETDDNLNFHQRTFPLRHGIIAQRKRLQFALLPIMYKIGVMTTLLTGLTFLAFKGLTIGVILLMFAFGNYFGMNQKKPPEAPQPIHVHVHSKDEKHSTHYEPSPQYGPSPHYEHNSHVDHTGWSRRIDAKYRSLKLDDRNCTENTTKVFVKQPNKLKAFQFYH